MKATDQLAIWWQEQTPRDQKFVMGGIATFVALLVIGGAIIPLFRNHAAASKSIEKRAKTLTKLVKIERAVRSKPTSIASSFGRGLGTESPISFIEGIADKAAVKDKIRNIKPGATEKYGAKRYTKVSFQMEGLTMKEFTDLLYELEVNSGNDVEITKIKSTRKQRKEAFLELQLDLKLLL